MHYPRSLTFLMLALFSLSVWADIFSDARRFLDQQQADRAFSLLNAHSDDYAGDPEFDYLLGIAALDSGYPSEAIFALERILDQHPEHALARAELARAYYLLGEDTYARMEFESLRQESLPTGVQETIDYYLSSIEQRTSDNPYDLNPYISLGIGFDGNVNSATDASQIALPALGNLLVTLDNSGRNQSSSILDLGAGIRFGSTLRQGIELFGRIDLNERLALKQPDFSTRSADGQLGLHWLKNKNSYRLTFQAQRFLVDGQTNRNLVGAQAQWQHQFNKSSQFSLYGQFSMQRFPDQSVRNVNNFTGGVAWMQVLDTENQGMLYGRLFLGTDDELTDSREDQGRDFGGLRIGAQYGLSRQILAFTSLNYQYSHYGSDDPIFLERRKDHYANLTVGGHYAINKNWSLRPQISYSHNSSSLPVNDYDRIEAMLTLRNDF